MFTACTRSHASTSVSRIDASSAGRDPRVVVEHVDPAETLGGRVAHRAHLRLVGNVHPQRERVALAQPHGLLGGLEIHVGHAYLRALRGEDLRRLAADPAARAGDHACLAVEPSHQASVERKTFLTSE